LRNAGRAASLAPEVRHRFAKGQADIGTAIGARVVVNDADFLLFLSEFID
jgi:hypothetical protein